MRPGPRPLAGIRQRDGTIAVPDYLADEVCRALVFAMNAWARDLGVVASPSAQRLLADLYAAAEHHRRSTAASPVDEEDQALAPAADAWTVREVADRMGCSTRWVRHLLAAGRLPGRRSGGTWIVYVDRPLPNPEAPQRTA